MQRVDQVREAVAPRVAGEHGGESHRGHAVARAVAQQLHVRARALARGGLHPLRAHRARRRSRAFAGAAHHLVR